MAAAALRGERMLGRKLETGTRVRLVAPSPLLTLTRDTGRVQGSAEWDGY